MLLSIVLLVALPAMAQQSASYDLSEHVLNSGGHPGAGATPTSSSYQITLGSIGDPLGISQLSGTGYQMTGGFIGRYLPPGEVSGLLFSDKTTLEWNPDPAAIQYNLYSSAIEDLPGSYGMCDQPGVPSTTTLRAPATPTSTWSPRKTGWASTAPAASSPAAPNVWGQSAPDTKRHGPSSNSSAASATAV